MPKQLYTKGGMSDLAYPEAFVLTRLLKTYMPDQLYTKGGMSEQLYRKACICNNYGHSYAQKLAFVCPKAWHLYVKKLGLHIHNLT
jgi:hypothetical protein